MELPEGILGLELHSKLNLIGEDTIAMIERAVAVAAERYDGLVIGTARRRPVGAAPTSR